MSKKFRITIILLIIAILSYSAFSATRPAAVAGSFYPADKDALSKMVTNHLAEVVGLPEIDGEIIALIVPHAGLKYSGQIAAHCYKLIEQSDYKNIILCGPSHRYGFEGLSVYGPDIIWQTPLSTYNCNNELCNHFLSYNSGIKMIKAAHKSEHSLEVQLPYLKTIFPDAKITPIVMGYQNSLAIDILARALTNISFPEKSIMIASTDWQHFKPASVGWLIDSVGIECLKNLDYIKLEQYLHSKKVEMCGGGPTVAVLKAAVARGADKVKILKYGDSGDITGDKSSVVSYVAAVIYKSSDTQKKPKTTESKSDNIENESSEYTLSDSDKRTLLRIARKTIESHLKNGSVPEFEVSDKLKQPGAAFVTLEKHQRLRGCIGQTVAVKPLYECVSWCAIQAAESDPRFPPVKPNELKDIEIEISVLTPLEKVTFLDEIKVGRDGLMIYSGRNRGLLLPQVATDYNWGRTTFLEQTCRKAGLPTDTYLSKDAEIYRFQALIFGEEMLLKH